LQFNRNCNFRKHKCDQVRNGKDFKIWRPYNRNKPYEEFVNKSDMNNNMEKMNPSKNHGEYI
jgi:hypothetical protein